MVDRQEDVWDAFVDAVLLITPAVERRSRYGDKPALWVADREVAHREAPGIIDLRITRAGWSQAQHRYGSDPAVRHDASRRDWIELHLGCASDLARVGELLTITVAANGGR
jgi:hypothetical protein